MNLHQLKFVREAIRQKFSLTEAANALHTSQPGISKAIIEFEDELGVEIFQRHGKRIKALTEPGQVVAQSVEKIMREIENLKRIGREYAAQKEGSLVVATTHTQARYVLPKVVQQFKQRYPDVRLVLLQGTPHQIADMVLQDQADVAIATEALAHYKELHAMPCYTWEHKVVVQKSHPLAKYQANPTDLTIEILARYPMITYDGAFAGRGKIDDAFAKRNIQPDIVLEAIDADVIKTYVGLGLGVGIIAGIAFDAQHESHLIGIPVGHLFGQHTTRLAVREHIFLRNYVFTFIELFASHLTKDKVAAVVAGNLNIDQL